MAMNLFQKIYNGMLGESAKSGHQPEKVVEVPEIRNSVILNELVEHFKDELEHRSFGERMLFPMSMTIVLEQSDFDAREEEFIFIVPEVVKEFYKVIVDKIPEFKDYRNPAMWWNFHFVSSELGDLQVGQKSMVVNKGHIVTMARIFDVLTGGNSNVSVGKVSVSLRNDQSNVTQRININKEVIANYELKSNTHIQVKFNKDLVYDERADLNVGPQCIAHISYTMGDKLYTYNMAGDHMIISGKSDTRKDRNIFRVESDKVQVGQAEIRWFPAKLCFCIAAYAGTVVDEEVIPVSTVEDMKWIPLSAKSEIILADDACLTFKSDI